MKKLMCFMLLFMVGCEHVHEHNVGECIKLRIYEKWEKGPAIMKILEVGHDHYHLVYVSPRLLEQQEVNNNLTIEEVDRIYKKTECP